MRLSSAGRRVPQRRDVRSRLSCGLIGTVAGRANRTPFASGSLPRGCGQSVSWLAEAIEASGAMAEALLAILELADQIAERNKIIGDNWQNAAAQLVARYLRRAVFIREQIDTFRPGCAKDLPSTRSAPACLNSAAELIDHADLSEASSVLTRETSDSGASSTSESSRSPRRPTIFDRADIRRYLDGRERPVTDGTGGVRAVRAVPGRGILRGSPEDGACREYAEGSIVPLLAERIWDRYVEIA
jgi:hypothetical protein